MTMAPRTESEVAVGERERVVREDAPTEGCHYARLKLGTHDNLVYVIADPVTKEAVCIDPAFDVPRLLEVLDAWEADLVRILHTHSHWDHIEGSVELAEATGATVYIHSADAEELRARGGDAEELRGDELLRFGTRTVNAHHTPGHTAGGMTYRIGRRLFTGDFCFNETAGRCDFPTGSKEHMWDSVQWLKDTFPGNHIICSGHDYGQEPEITLAEAKARNPALVHASFEDFSKEWFLEAY